MREERNELLYVGGIIISCCPLIISTDKRQEGISLGGLNMRMAENQTDAKSPAETNDLN